MTSKPIPMCGKHHIQKEWRATTFEYSEEGITIRVPNVYAWVCPESNEASFTPETVDELITTVRELLAERPDAHKLLKRHPIPRRQGAVQAAIAPQAAQIFCLEQKANFRIHVLLAEQWLFEELNGAY